MKVEANTVVHSSGDDDIPLAIPIAAAAAAAAAVGVEAALESIGDHERIHGA